MKEDKISFFKSIGGKITLMFVVVVALAIGVVTLISVQQSTASMMDLQFNQLRAIREIKAGQIEGYFEERAGDLAVLRETTQKIYNDSIELIETSHRAKVNDLEAYLQTLPRESLELTKAETGRSQFPYERVNRLVQQRKHLGQTGESYLVGRTNGRTVYQSDRVVKDGRIGQEKGGAGVQMALDGRTGHRVKEGSTGTIELEVYSPVEVSGIEWVMISTVALKEVLAPQLSGSNLDYFQYYIQQYGYYDLFLVHPDGQVYYTAEQESDYNTNILSGKYSDSNLSTAVTQALNTKSFAFADFKPYAPSGGAPAAFIVEPIEENGKIISVVALQLPLDQINDIMQERTGMGETGESYLVGPENLMRSDSFLDPENHSVQASFARPQTGRVETEAATSALSGETAARIIIDYNGNPVLSAFGPVQVYDTSWALMSEIDEAEVRAPINTLTTFILITALVMIAIAIAAAVMFSRTLSKPILLLVSGAKNLAVGDIALSDVLAEDFDKIKQRKDELGVIGDSFSSVIDYQTEKAQIAQEIANKNLQVEASVSSEKDTLGKAFKEMVAALNELLSQVNNSVEQVNSGADQVSQASQNLSQGATEQASSLEEITSSTNEINSQSKQNAENATEALSLAKQATSDAEKGNQQMLDMTGIMERINASSDQINKVVKVIDDIAFQINLLALNANVEAARAGKYGKGFAVVADEVRNLAVKSADSVKETTQMVEETVTNIKQGTEAADQTASQLESIVEGSGKVAEFLEEIAQSSREQAQAISQITEGLDQIDEATQASTASSEESASASEELAGQAQQLRSMVAQFKLDERYAGAVRQISRGSHVRNQAQRPQYAATGGNDQWSQQGAQKAQTQASTETGIKPVKPEEQINLEDDDFDRF